MIYSEWLDRVWLAVCDCWSDLDDTQRKLGVPCDVTLLAKLKVQTVSMGDTNKMDFEDALESLHCALKAIEGMGQLLEILPDRFRLVGSARHLMGQSLAPLHDIYQRQALPSDASLFLEQLAKTSVSRHMLRTSQSDPLASSWNGDYIAYPLTNPQDAAEVFRQLGWEWVAPIDQAALEIIYTLKEVGMVETIYRGGKVMCAPTFKGLLRIENAFS